MESPPQPIDVAPVIDWLVGGARGVPPDPEALLPALWERLRASGIAIDRAAVFVRPLHPNVAARALYWRAEQPGVAVNEEGHGFVGSDEHLASPIHRVTRTRGEVRVRLHAGEPVETFPVVADLRAGGYTDYLIVPLEFVDGDVHALSVATRREGGFRDDEIAALRRALPAVTRMTEILAMRRKSANILDAYLGREAGAKVLQGRIRRGDAERIHAVIWFCDLRESTVLADAIGPERFLATLNDYCECVLSPVMARGGEVLSFVGDAALAIFRVDADPSGPATQAVDAAREAIASMRELNARRAAQGAPALRFGIGLHVGDVLFGNVGTSARVAFTVVGPATNEAARIESMCKVLDATPLVSAAIAAHTRFAWKTLGTHRLRGVDAPVELYTL